MAQELGIQRVLHLDDEQIGNAELLPVAYFHVVFNLPAAIADIAYSEQGRHLRHSRPTSSISVLASASPRFCTLGARRSSAPLHDRARRRRFARWLTLGVLPAGLLPWCGCSRASSAGCSRRSLTPHTNIFSSSAITLHSPQAFAAYLAPLRKIEWVVYSKRPFGGPDAVLTYLSRYTHRVAIRQQPPDRTGQQLPDQRPRSIQAHDARHRRVHPAISHPCAATRLPPHPPLWTVRQNLLRRQHRTRPRIARRP
jgi:hypothetical protein